MTISLTEDFKTVEKLGQDVQAVLAQVRKHGRPLVITQNGKPGAVLLPVEEYERLVHTLNLARLLAEGEADIRAGKTRPVDEFFAELLGEDKRAKKVSSADRSRR